ncbi:bifunctional N-acetylglucosamine-1-phosphate uridyltransferase/glucosamine-1-phosphate acetyltransferase [Candidatus Riesia sp. GBBU]|nr:bifunctional N-acetylglucosamine-1-phosphate uridyltransferase/glucosamine-1-phosphate acetyltransferase [Candidatus Riesia sp. GBBU]
MSNLYNVVILAAGKGKRMNSDLPKPLHMIGGKPMVQYIIETSLSLNPSKVYLLCSKEIRLFKELVNNKQVQIIFQKKQLGTGYAIYQMSSFLDDKEDVLIMYGDVPLIKKETLRDLIKFKRDNDILLLTAKVSNPEGYGRIIRKHGKITHIEEEKNLLKEHKIIDEIYTGILFINGKDLKYLLKKLKIDRDKKEYHITDIIHIADKNGFKIKAFHSNDSNEIQGVNNFLQLSNLEKNFQIEIAKRLCLSGVMIHDLSKFILRGELKHGKNVIIDINVVIEGKVSLGNNVHIHSGCIIKNCVIGDFSVIKPYSILEGSKISNNCIVGPFSNIRSGTELSGKVYIGNFVEVKKSFIGTSSKIGHMSYIGDSEIGSNTNIGAGTITCNFNGIKKLKTKIGNNVFIGSNSQLIAPICISDGATIGAGTTITRNVSSNELVVSRIKQRHLLRWKRIQKDYS